MAGMRGRLASCGTGGGGVGLCGVVRAGARVSSGMGGGPTAMLGAVTASMSSSKIADASTSNSNSV